MLNNAYQCHFPPRSDLRLFHCTKDRRGCSGARSSSVLINTNDNSSRTKSDLFSLLLTFLNMENVTEFEGKVDNLSICLALVGDSVKNLNGNSLHGTNLNIGKIEQAKLNIVIAYSLGSLLFISQNLKGDRESPVSSQLLQEISRIRKYVELVKTCEGTNQEQKKRKLTIDKSAAARLIQFEMLKNK